MTIERFQYYATKEGLKRGMEQGLQQGLEKGMQQGMEQGMQQGMQKQKAIDEKIIAQKDKEMAELRAEIEKLKAQL